MTTLHFAIPSGLWISANDRIHWANKSRRTKALRQLGWATATAAGLKDAHLGLTAVWAHIGYPRAGRADPNNASPVTKALIDGMVDAGVWIDDDHTHVMGPHHLRDKGSGQAGVHTVRLVLVGQEVPF